MIYYLLVGRYERSIHFDTAGTNFHKLLSAELLTDKWVPSSLKSVYKIINNNLFGIIYKPLN